MRKYCAVKDAAVKNATKSSKTSDNGNKIDVSRLLKIRGLPWTTTKKELRDFFAGVKMLNGLDGIHFISDDPNCAGIAYIQLATKRDYDRAKEFHRKNLDGRYIDGMHNLRNTRTIQTTNR